MMKVLYVTASCLTKNTSANMSHNAFVKGLIDCGCDVSVIMAKDSWGKEDKALPRWESVKYYEYNAESWVERLRKKGRTLGGEVLQVDVQSETNIHKMKAAKDPTFFFNKNMVRTFMKKMFYAFVKHDSLYPLEYEMFHSVMAFKEKNSYDVVISNSSPAASHKIVYLLARAGNIKYKRWIQIWEDPWCYDLYGGYSPKVFEEEHRLLLVASEVYYVSPLTMMYQKKYFEDCSPKMSCVPLPFFSYTTEREQSASDGELVFGYFGDYYSQTRNLQPFYDALHKTGYQGYIYGDSNLILKSTDKIEISRRVTLDVLSDVQHKTNVLVHLCNLRGGQIPGKIYHYSATNKKILFILDGTEEEQEMIYGFFSRFNRYYFCNNTENDIIETIYKMIIDNSVSNQVVQEFEPKNVVQMILNKESLI